MVKTNKPKNDGRGGPKLTPQLQVEISELLKLGCYIETACAMAGISRSTYYNWIDKAKTSNRRNKYTLFMDAVTHAQACDEARLVGMINVHCKDKWRASAWMLERRFTNNWGKMK
jgi:hypothetical protein